MPAHYLNVRITVNCKADSFLVVGIWNVYDVSKVYEINVLLIVA